MAARVKGTAMAARVKGTTATAVVASATVGGTEGAVPAVAMGLVKGTAPMWHW
jgi:hypothetical protein